MGLFKRLLGKEDEVDPILGARSEPSGLEARPVEPGLSSTPTPAPAPQPAAEPLDMSSPLDMWKLARQLQDLHGDPQRVMAQLQQMFPGAQIDVQQQTTGDPEAAARWMQQFYAAQGVDTGGDDDEDDEIAQLERLAALHQRGALSDDEFAAAKAKLLGGA
jgi:Short C-terminal domain